MEENVGEQGGSKGGQTIFELSELAMVSGPVKVEGGLVKIGGGEGWAVEAWDGQQKLLRIDGWNLAGFLATQMFCLIMAIRRGFLVPWQAAMGCNILTGGVLMLRFAHPLAYLRRRFMFMVVCRAACTFGALFAATGLIQAVALQMNLGVFNLRPGLAGLAAMASCTMFKSTFLKEHVGRLSTVFHTFEVLGIGCAGLRTFPQLRATPNFSLATYWGVIILVWGLLPLFVSTFLLRSRPPYPPALTYPSHPHKGAPIGSPRRIGAGPASVLLQGGAAGPAPVPGKGGSVWGWLRHRGAHVHLGNGAVASAGNGGGWRAKLE